MTRLEQLLLEHSVKRGTFTLASGKTSDFYVDVRQTALHAEGAKEVARHVYGRIANRVHHVGGVELGAVPIVGSVLMVADDLHGFVVRKKAKAHGTGSRIERCPPPGTPVAVVEDTTTTGASLLEALLVVRDAGLEVVNVITVVDREEGAKELLAAEGFDLLAVTTRSALLG